MPWLALGPLPRSYHPASGRTRHPRQGPVPVQARALVLVVPLVQQVQQVQQVPLVPAERTLAVPVVEAVAELLAAVVPFRVLPVGRVLRVPRPPSSA